MWLLYAFSGPVLWAVSTHIDKFLVDKYFRHSDTAVLMVFTALLGVIALPVIWFFDPKVLGLSLTATTVMTLSGILYMGAMLFYLRAIQTEEASVVAPLFQANTVFTFVLGILILHELPLRELDHGSSFRMWLLRQAYAALDLRTMCRLTDGFAEL